MGLPVIKYTVGLFIVYPLAFVLRMLPSSHLKHFFSLLGGLLLMQWVFGVDWIHSAITSGVTYLLCLVMPRKILPSVVFVWVMGYMICAHVYRMKVRFVSPQLLYSCMSTRENSSITTSQPFSTHTHTHTHSHTHTHINTHS